jgi:hypothetical protein
MECKNFESRRQIGKFEKRKCRRTKVAILGVCEVRWKGQGEIRSGDYTVYYSGGELAEKV